MGIFSFSINYTKLLILVIVTVLIILWWVGEITYSCPIKSFTTFNCAMCKSTRAIKLLLELKLKDSFLMNPLALFWAYFIALTYFKLFIESFNIKHNDNYFNVKHIFKNNYLKYSVLFIVVLNTIYLNFYS